MLSRPEFNWKCCFDVAANYGSWCCKRRNHRVPNFILAFIPAQINRNTLNTMTAFAVCLSLSIYIHHRGPQLGCPFRHIKPDRHTDHCSFLNNLYGRTLNRLVDSSPTCSSIWCHTPSWVNIRTTPPISSWSRRSGTYLSGNVPQSLRPLLSFILSLSLSPCGT